MQENRRTYLRFKLALQHEKVLHEIKLYEELLLEYSEHLNQSFSASTRAREFFIPPHINENYNCNQSFCICDGTLTAVTNIMGIESFLKKIRALFTSNTNGREDNREKSRKRRNDNVLDLEQQQHQPLKYRRVDNNFPKFLPMSEQINEQDDDDCVLTGAVYNSLNYNSSNTQSATNTIITTSEQTNGPVKYNLQRSIFDAPQTTRKIVKCNNTVDIQIDDDEDLYKNFVKQDNNTNDVDGFEGNRKSHKPIERCDLTSGSTNWTTINTANLAHGTQPPMCKMKSTTSTSVVHNSEYLLCSSSMSSHEAPSAGSTFTFVNSCWTPLPNRAGIKERENFDHGEYLRLLQKHMPRVYCSTLNGEIKEQHIIKCTKQRVSAECEIVQQPFSSTKINIDGAYNKQEIRKIVIDDDNDIVESDSRMCSNIDLRKQSASVQIISQSKQHTQHSELVELTEDEDDDEGVIEEILNINGLDKSDNDNNTDSDDVLPVVDTKALTVANSANLLPNESATNKLRDRLLECDIMRQNWANEFEHKWAKINESILNESQLIESQLKEMSSAREKYIREVLSDRLGWQISIQEKPSLPEQVKANHESDDEIKADIIMPLNEVHLQMLHSYLQAPDNKVLITKFNLSITRHDILSLCDANWLNDEVINFYMNLLTERSEQRTDLPSVYAMNTFFLQRLMNGGYAAVKRWTRKVNIFAKDIIPVPVHIGGVHWCMAIIHLKEKTIKYYDSMGQANEHVLKALETYLRHESMDKRKHDFDTRQFKIESILDSPRQTNGSDCGVFSCMTAEYITRGRPITFTQGNMDYFRQKMILEIVGGQLWQ